MSLQASELLQMQIGALTLAQAASQLPVEPGMQVFALRRLIARRSIIAGTNAMLPDTRITIEVLKDFLENGAASRDARNAAGLPPETLLPIFPADGRWFAPSIGQDIVPQIKRLLRAQLPSSYRDVLEAARWAGIATPGQDSQLPQGSMTIQLTAMPWLQSTPSPADGSRVKSLADLRWGQAAIALGDTYLPAMVDSEMEALIRQPLGPMTIYPSKGGELFRNMGELYLVTRMQSLAFYEAGKVNQRLYSKPGVIGQSRAPGEAGELATFYASPSNYGEIIGASVESMKLTKGSCIAYMTTPGLGFQAPPRQLYVFLSDAAILKICDSSYERLTALAF